MQQKNGSAILVAAVAALAWDCNHNSSPTTPGGAVSSASSANLTTTSSSTSQLPDPGGEWILTTPSGLPANGCVSLSSLSSSDLNWTVQAVAGHQHRILLEGIWTWEAQPGCDPLASGGDLTRDMQITGGGWTFLAGEQGTRTISWPTSYCGDDGGRIKLDVLVKRDVPSIGEGDREAVELIVDCGFVRQP